MIRGLKETMRQALESSDSVLPICTPHFLARVQSEDTNVAYEFRIIQSKGAKNKRCVLPLIFEGNFDTAVPKSLKEFIVLEMQDTQTYADAMTGLKPVGVLPYLLESSPNHREDAYRQHYAEFRSAHLSRLLPSVPEGLVARPGLQAKIDAQLAQNTATTLVPATLQGTAGVGKTLSACVFAHQSNYPVRIWLAAEELSSLTNCFLPVARTLGVTPGKELIDWLPALYHALHNVRTLFIFDNVPDAAHIQAYLPEKNPNHHVLITSRSDDWPSTLAIDSFTQAEAVDYLKKHHPESTSEDRAELAKKLDYLPLFLNQLSQYARFYDLSLSHINEKLAASSELLKKSAQPASFHQNVFNHPIGHQTWALSQEKIFQTPENKTVLLTCTLLNPDAITLKELTALTQLSEDTVLETLTYLRRTGFLQGHHNSYRLHRTWQTVIRDAALCAEDTTLVSSISQHLNKVFSDIEAQRKNPQPYLTWLAHGAAFCKAIEPWIEPWLSQKTNVLASVSDTLGNVGNFYCLSGQYQLAKNMLETALTLKKAHYGENHVNVARTLHNLATAIGALGDPKKQKALLEQALIINKNHYGENHVEVANTLHNLATAIGALGDYQKKKALLEQALIINKKHYGENHVEVATTLENLANAIGALGDHQKEKALLEQALIINKKHYGENHVEVARTLYNLATAIGALGDHKKRKALLEQALIIIKKHYGENHVNVAITLENLATAIGALGDHKKRKALLEQALIIEKKHYGENHVAVAMTLENLANAIGDLGDPQKQKALLEQALIINKNHYGENHVDVARTLGNLANAIGDLGDPQKKKTLLEQALIIKKNHYGENHVNVAITLENLANAIGALGDHQKKKALLEQALIINKKHYGENHLEVARTLANLSIAERNLKQFQNALSQSKRACDIMTNFYDTHPLKNQIQQMHQNNQNAASRTTGFFDNHRAYVPQAEPAKGPFF